MGPRLRGLGQLAGGANAHGMRGGGLSQSEPAFPGCAGRAQKVLWVRPPWLPRLGPASCWAGLVDTPWTFFMALLPSWVAMA